MEHLKYQWLFSCNVYQWSRLASFWILYDDIYQILYTTVIYTGIRSTEIFEYYLNFQKSKYSDQAWKYVYTSKADTLILAALSVCSAADAGLWKETEHCRTWRYWSQLAPTVAWQSAITLYVLVPLQNTCMSTELLF